jgi:hypothetical protein
MLRLGVKGVQNVIVLAPHVPAPRNEGFYRVAISLGDQRPQMVMLLRHGIHSGKNGVAIS